MSKQNKQDNLFKERFGIETPIVYIEDVRIQRGCQEEFMQAWKKFYRRAKPLTSPSRHERLASCLRRIWRKKNDALYCQRVTIRFIDQNVGFGVFAVEDIPPYSTLTHYAGILRPERSIQTERDSTFAFTKFKPFSIDAMHYGNWARFMNHGEEGKPETNVIAWEIYLPAGPRIVFSAGRHGIKKGEQLLYSYGDEYWEEKEFKKL
jgi:SET domain-containing protein